MKKFDIPEFYRSPIIGKVKALRKDADKMKKDFSPTLLDFGPVRFLVARHFGFCYGVENAIEIIYRTLDENPGRNIYLISEMIHNPGVNTDLLERGIKFMQDTLGNQIIPWGDITSEDIVVIPAFGTTVANEQLLKSKGVQIEKYDTTCPFVEKVWNRSKKLSDKGFTIVIHGKAKHEETRATFSHAAANGPTVIVQNMKEAQELANYIDGKKNRSDFYSEFDGKYSEGFEVERDLQNIGVVNQTTMLASDTQAIADYLRGIVVEQHSEDNVADTRDTLCYATSDNQQAVYGLLEEPSDLAIVIGGYNSSNTSHLVELCEEKLPTYHIDSPDRISSMESISHFLFRSGEEKATLGFLKSKNEGPITISITGGASSPDSLVDKVIQKIASFYQEASADPKISAQ